MAGVTFDNAGCLLLLHAEGTNICGRIHALNLIADGKGLNCIMQAIGMLENPKRKRLGVLNF